jgi:stage V sporulation protein R
MDPSPQSHNDVRVSGGAVPLAVELAALQPVIEQLAADAGLTFFPVIFEPVSARELTIVAAREGFPVRYPHWRFGQQFEELWRGYDYGTQKIYELVINNDPAVAYLMKSNSLTEQKLVMAHVYGHVDFFKNNLYFAHTDRQMLNRMGDHAAIVRSCMDEHGREVVERWIDVCRSLDNLIGLYPQVPRPYRPIHEVFAAQPSYPSAPVRDVLRFLLEHADIEPWQRSILGLVRDEAHYFQPQAQTKIMNEGWAAFWHTNLMQAELVNPAEAIHYCKTHAGVVGSMGGQLNPYKLGVELFKDIEDRWNKGRFGPAYDRCTDYAQKLAWDSGAGLGREKVFEVRKTHNDATFLREFFTFEFARASRYLPTHNERREPLSLADQWGLFSDMREKLLRSLTNRGDPVIELVEANYEGRGEFLLRHEHAGEDIHVAKAEPTLANLFLIWGRPVHLYTQLDGQGTILSYDGSEHRRILAN